MRRWLIDHAFLSLVSAPLTLLSFVLPMGNTCRKEFHYFVAPGQSKNHIHAQELFSVLIVL
jgi:hypothetical protein